MTLYYSYCKQIKWCEINCNPSWFRVKVIWRHTGWRESKICHLRLQQSSDTAMSRRTQRTEAQMGEFGKTQVKAQQLCDLHCWKKDQNSSRFTKLSWWNWLKSIMADQGCFASQKALEGTLHYQQKENIMQVAGLAGKRISFASYSLSFIMNHFDALNMMIWLTCHRP